MAQSLFVHPREDYTRDLNIRQHYIEDAALYLSKNTQRPLAECVEFVKEKITESGQDPRTFCLTKQTPGNRTKRVTTFEAYLNDAATEGNIISPTLATYTNPLVQRSLIAEYVQGNLALRKVKKKAKFAAEQKGDLVAMARADNEQSSIKILNNSVSGAHASEHNPLFNKSSHSTLTSTCRCASGSANANNERFLAGNRHYWRPEIAINNITSIIQMSNYNDIEVAMDLFSLVYPSVEDVLAAVKTSCDLYWESPHDWQYIERLIRTLTPTERAAFLYTGDFYHLSKLNDGFCREFVGQLAQKITDPVDNPKEWIKELDDDQIALIGLLCHRELKGQSIWDDSVTQSPDYGIIGATAKNILETLPLYEMLIKAFWVTKNMPFSIAVFPTSVRRVVAVSDTDSTIFTVQDWVQWYCGDIGFDDTAQSIAAVIVYLSSQVTAHLMAQLSGNMGVTPEHMFILAMKNEFMFPVFAVTNRSKHYFAYISSQEGNVKQKLGSEIKGVALRNSNVPKTIMEHSQAIMKRVMDYVMRGEQVPALALLEEIGDVERQIRHSIERGDSEFLKHVQVKPVDSYKYNPEPGDSPAIIKAKQMRTPYKHYSLWNEVFGEKYGFAPTPPYVTVKATLDTGSKTALKEWVAKWEDVELAQRFWKWMNDNHKASLTNLQIPYAIVSSNGIPKEILEGMDIRKLIFQIMESFYITLESLGLYYLTPDNTRLVSDLH